MEEALVEKLEGMLKLRSALGLVLSAHTEALAGKSARTALFALMLD
ncbi:MAG: hypothetical protein K6E40_02890 [Desulfovibrio sp.]|nr:hypothetical protein [Desulfovibrio sp.]